MERITVSTNYSIEVLKQDMWHIEAHIMCWTENKLLTFTPHKTQKICKLGCFTSTLCSLQQCYTHRWVGIAKDLYYSYSEEQQTIPHDIQGIGME